MDQSDAPSSAVDASAYTYVVGIDVGSQTCSMCVLKPNKSQVIKPTDFANAAAGFALLHDKLEQLGVPPDQLLIGLEATSPDAREPLPLFAESRLPSLPAASQANASVCAATWLASQNRQIGRHHHRPRVAQR